MRGGGEGTHMVEGRALGGAMRRGEEGTTGLRAIARMMDGGGGDIERLS